MAARRSFQLSLPASDPLSAAINAVIDAQLLAGGDVSGELRRLIGEALRQSERLSAIEAKLDRILAGGIVAVAAPVEPTELTAAERQAIGDMLDYGE